MWVIVNLSSHGTSVTSTQLGAAHTQARQSCSQHSSRRLSDVCVWGVCVCVGTNLATVMQPDTQIINKSPTEHRTKLLLLNR